MIAVGKGKISVLLEASLGISKALLSRHYDQGKLINTKETVFNFVFVVLLGADVFSCGIFVLLVVSLYFQFGDRFKRERLQTWGGR